MYILNIYLIHMANAELLIVDIGTAGVVVSSDTVES